MRTHRDNIRAEIIAYLNAHPGCTFEQMVTEWIRRGKTIHSGDLWQFVVSQGLSGRFAS